MNGWIKLYRKLIDWEWFTDTNTLQLFIYLLCEANVEQKRYKGVVINRGEVVVGRKALAERLCRTEQEIRTALEHLKATNEITSKATNKFTIVTICNYDKYQVVEDCEQPTKQPTSQPTNNQQTTTPKEYKNTRNKEDNNSKENIKRKADREMEFRNEVALIANGKYEQSMIDNFCDYWTESNDGENSKMRFEREKVFDKARRLTTWFNRSKNYGRTNNRITTDAEYRQQTAEAIRLSSEFFAKGGSPF